MVQHVGTTRRGTIDSSNAMVRAVPVGDVAREKQHVPSVARHLHKLHLCLGLWSDDALVGQRYLPGRPMPWGNLQRGE